MKKFLPILVVLILLTACAPTGPAERPIAYQDNFDDTSSGWFADTFEAGEHSYHNGSYRILLNSVDWFSWVVNPSAVVYGDIRVEVDASKLSGPDVNEYGVVCRVDYEAGSLYAGVVSSNGSFAVYKSLEDGPLELIDMATMGFSNAVKTGGESNHIRFDCIGSTLTLYANDTQLVQVTDDTLTSGEVGLYSGTFDPGGTEILFDNFVVYQP